MLRQTPTPRTSPARPDHSTRPRSKVVGEGGFARQLIPGTIAQLMVLHFYTSAAGRFARLAERGDRRSLPFIDRLLQVLSRHVRPSVVAEQTPGAATHSSPARGDTPRVSSDRPCVRLQAHSDPRSPQLTLRGNCLPNRARRLSSPRESAGA